MPPLPLAGPWYRRTVDECGSRDIAFVPFFPLGWPRGGRYGILGSRAVAELARRLGATPSQLALAWLLDLALNNLLIPGTRSREHLAENVGAAGVQLDDAARAELAERFPAVRTG